MVLMVFPGMFAVAAQGDSCMSSDGSAGTMSSSGSCVKSGGTGGSMTTGGGGGTMTTGSQTQVSEKLQNPIGGPHGVNTFSELVSKVISTAVLVVMPFVIVYFIYAGFLFVKAQGNPEGITEAKSAMTWSIVGAFILLGAEAFAQIIGTTVNSITGV
jgi:hypothetical protein